MHENNVIESIYLNPTNNMRGTFTVTASRGWLPIRTGILINGRIVTDINGFSSFAGWILGWILIENPLICFFINQRACSCYDMERCQNFTKNDSCSLYGFLFIRSFSFHSRIFAHLGTSLLPIKDCKLCPVLDSHGHEHLWIL